MNAKTYRVEKELVEKTKGKMIKYITENQEIITEAQMINACIKKGLETITDKDIKEFVG